MVGPRLRVASTARVGQSRQGRPDRAVRPAPPRVKHLRALARLKQTEPMATAPIDAMSRAMRLAGLSARDAAIQAGLPQATVEQNVAGEPDASPEVRTAVLAACGFAWRDDDLVPVAYIASNGDRSGNRAHVSFAITSAVMIMASASGTRAVLTGSATGCG